MAVTAAPPLLRLFFQDTEEEVLATKLRARQLIAEGKTIMKVAGSDGKESEKAFPMDPVQVLVECNAALKHLNPAKYGRLRRKSHSFFGYNGFYQA